MIGAALAGAIGGLGEGIVAEAKAKREAALKRIEQEMLAERDQKEMDFRRSERLGAQEFQSAEAQRKETMETEKARANAPRPMTADEISAWNLPGDQPWIMKDGTPTIPGGKGQTINIGGEPGDGALRKKLDEKTGELWSTYQEQGSTSAAMNQDMEILDELIKVAPQGALTGRLAEMFPGLSAPGDAFQSIVKRIAPTLRAPGSGSTSDIEYDGMLRSLPALRNQPEANTAIAAIMKSKAAINIERGEIVSAYARGDVSAAEARKMMSEIDKRSILTPELRSNLEGLGVTFDATKTTDTPSDIDDLLKKYGGAGG